MDYTKYSDDELIDSYTTMIDYSGKAEPGILAEIQNRGGMENFLKQKEINKNNKKEVARISKEVQDSCKNFVGADLEFIRQSITSEVLSKEELDYLVERKFMEHSATLADKEIDSNTITGSIVGTLIGAVLGAVFLIICTAIFKRLVFSLLIGVYIISYQTIKFITKKSRNNVAVFIASLVATLLALAISLFFAGILLHW